MVIVLAIVIRLAVASLIGAVFLRAAVAWANKVFQPDPSEFRRAFSPAGAPETEPNFDSLADLDSDTPSAGSNPFAGSNNPVGANGSTSNNPYAAPTNYGSSKTKTQRALKLAIPEPTYGRACGISLVHALCVTITSLSLLALGDLLATLISTGLAFAVATLIYSRMLPTTAVRAFVVYLFQVLIMIAVVAVFAIGITSIMAILS